MYHTAFERLPLLDAELWLQRSFLRDDEATHCFDLLLHELEWRQGSVTLFGRKHDIPRLQAWYGDVGAQYTYSGMRLSAAPWTVTLDTLKTRIGQIADVPFNSVLANFYRDGADSVGWHSDNERDLGKDPVIASLSLGATRRFQLRHRGRPELPVVNIDLAPGDLLIMAGPMQSHWHHQIPKTAKRVGPRINLTFRLVKGTTATDCRV